MLNGPEYICDTMLNDSIVEMWRKIGDMGILNRWIFLIWDDKWIWEKCPCPSVELSLPCLHMQFHVKSALFLSAAQELVNQYRSCIVCSPIGG